MGEYAKHWPLVIRAALFSLAILAASPVQACRQALVVGLDVSGSVDSREYQLQRNGLAAALMAPAVQDLIIGAGSAPMEIAVFEWSGPAHQVLIQSWVAIDGVGTLARVAQNLRTQPRVSGSPTTAIGSAMFYGAALLDQRQSCWKRTIDISGDGPANTGPRPQDVTGLPTDIVVNALVIGAADQSNRDERAADIKELSSYFSAYVIRGSGAFVEVALGFEDYAAAMERKLLRELQALALSAAEVDRMTTEVLQ